MIDDLFVSDEELEQLAKKHTAQKTKLKEEIGVSTTEVVNQLSTLKSATCFYEVFGEISKVAQEKKINIYVYRKLHGIRKRKKYFDIYAVPAGVQKEFHSQKQDKVICKVEMYPSTVKLHKHSKQYKLLLELLQKLNEY